MFDPDFDPLETLKNHDEWILKIAQHMEELARAGANMARAVEQHEGQFRRLIKLIEHQQKLIIQLNDRLEKLEKQ